jgi:hypothetical protein
VEDLQVRRESISFWFAIARLCFIHYMAETRYAYRFKVCRAIEAEGGSTFRWWLCTLGPARCQDPPSHLPDWHESEVFSTPYRIVRFCVLDGSKES